MEIIYIWVNNYRGVLKDCEFNFGGKYRFNFIAKNNYLTYVEDENYQEGFYHKDILNISVIIGKNGAGKSFLLEMLMDSLALGTGDDRIDMIIIGIESGNTFIYSNSKRRNTITKSKSFLDLNMSFNDSLKDFLSDREIVYYTNSFYDRVDYHNTAGIINVSLKNLVFNEDYKLTLPFSMNQDILIQHEFAEVFRLIKLLKDKRGVLQFSIPKFLILNIDDRSEYFYNSRKIVSVDAEKKSDYLKKYFKNISIDESRSNIEKFRLLLQKALLFHNLYVGNNMSYRDFERLLRTKGVTNFLFEETNLGDVYKSLDSLAHDNNTSFDGKKVWIDLDLLAFDNLVVVLDKYFKTINYETGYLQFNFSYTLGQDNAFSAGEKAYLAMFSRMYSLSKSQQPFSNLQINKSALILIDEGELYFHPEWQKSFILSLIEYLPVIFPNTKLQIIITTHSPIILSDIPLNKIIMLEKKDGHIETKSSFDKDRGTFGSNIHELYTDSFFIENGLIGRFAKKKIEWVVNKLEPESDVGSKEEIQKIINQIGEPIIKDRLQEMFDDKFETNESILEKIKVLESRLKSRK